jgi:hypothetical protein
MSTEDPVVWEKRIAVARRRAAEGNEKAAADLPKMEALLKASIESMSHSSPKPPSPGDLPVDSGPSELPKESRAEREIRMEIEKGQREAKTHTAANDEERARFQMERAGDRARGTGEGKWGSPESAYAEAAKDDSFVSGNSTELAGQAFGTKANLGMAIDPDAPDARIRPPLLNAGQPKNDRLIELGDEEALEQKARQKNAALAVSLGATLPLNYLVPGSGFLTGLAGDVAIAGAGGALDAALSDEDVGKGAAYGAATGGLASIPFRLGGALSRGSMRNLRDMSKYPDIAGDLNRAEPQGYQTSMGHQSLKPTGDAPLLGKQSLLEESEGLAKGKLIPAVNAEDDAVTALGVKAKESQSPAGGAIERYAKRLEELAQSDRVPGGKESDYIPRSRGESLQAEANRFRDMLAESPGADMTDAQLEAVIDRLQKEANAASKISSPEQSLKADLARELMGMRSQAQKDLVSAHEKGIKGIRNVKDALQWTQGKRLNEVDSAVGADALGDTMLGKGGKIIDDPITTTNVGAALRNMQPGSEMEKVIDGFVAQNPELRASVNRLRGQAAAERLREGHANISPVDTATLRKVAGFLSRGKLRLDALNRGVSKASGPAARAAAQAAGPTADEEGSIPAEAIDALRRFMNISN